MTATESLKLYEILRRYINNDLDAKSIVQEFEATVDRKFDEGIKNFATKTELEIIRKDIDLAKSELKTAIFESESRLKSEINKLIVWIIGIIFTASIVFFALSKFVNS